LLFVIISCLIEWIIVQFEQLNFEGIV